MLGSATEKEVDSRLTDEMNILNAVVDRLVLEKLQT